MRLRDSARGRCGVHVAVSEPLVHWDVCTNARTHDGRLLLVLPCGAAREVQLRDGTWREVNAAGYDDEVTCESCRRIFRVRFPHDGGVL